MSPDVISRPARVLCISTSVKTVDADGLLLLLPHLCALCAGELGVGTT